MKGVAIMKWKKLGRVFNPVEHHLPDNCFEFAQSPQALLFDNFVRIYFSTRERDTSGKYLSHISFVDFDFEFKNILNLSKETVISLGGLGCFDEHGIFPLNVLRHENKILGYIGGWSRRVAVSVETAIGLAVSHDQGETFTRVGAGPVLTASQYEPFLVGDPFVRVFNGTYHMWYIYGVRWIRESGHSVPERVYKIGHATSPDGVAWRKTSKQVIKDRLNIDECQALPTVIECDKTFHMFFCYRQALGFRNQKESAYRIGYAYSDNLVRWVRDDAGIGIDVSEGGWDSDMMCYPHVFRVGSDIYMLYNGNEFGRYGFGLAKLEN